MRNTYSWLLQIITGVLIAVLLGIHMVLQHLDAILGFFGADTVDLTSWSSMIDRLEATSSAKVKNIITWSFIILGVGVFAWATYVPISLFTS